MSQIIHCPLCEQSDYTVLYEDLSDHLTGIDGQFRLVVCKGCQLVYQNPQLDAAEIQQYYQEDYVSYFRGTKNNLSLLQWFLLNYGLRKRAQPLLQDNKQGRLLDVGCATGHFLYYMQQHSAWQVYGLEPNAEAARFAQEQFQLDVHVGYLEDKVFPDNYFDAVSLWDVFEHLSDPSHALEEIRRILKPNGLLVLRVPLIHSLDARLFGRYWIGLDQPRHYLLFSHKTLQQMLTQASYRPVGYGPSSGSFFPFMLSLQSVLFTRWGRNRFTEALFKMMRSLPMRILSAPYFFIVDQLGLGPQGIVVAKVKKSVMTEAEHS